MANNPIYTNALLAALAQRQPNALASTLGASVDLVNRYTVNQPNALFGSDAIMANPNNLAAALLYQQEQNQRRKALVQPQSVEDVVQDTFGMQPGLDRATFLPMAGTRSQKNLQFAAPGIVYDAAKALATPLAAWRGANVTPEDAFNVAGNVMGGGLSASALRPVESGVIGANVYHGTPHRFPATEANPLGEFDASKMGTGEGAQAYGHGHYLAEKPETAVQYQEFLSSRNNDLTNPENLAASLMYRTPEGTREAGIREAKAALNGVKNYPNSYEAGAKELTEKALAILESGVPLAKQGGTLYKVDLPDDQIAKMLDWDKPLSEQPESVRKFFEPLTEKAKAVARQSGDASWGEFAQPYDYDPTGKELMQIIGRHVGGDRMTPDGVLGGGTGGPKVSAMLNAAGIPGIRYLDGGSRGSGNGTRNFVVFPGKEKKLKILERNGEKADPQEIAKALQLVNIERRMKERFGEFAQAHNLGLPDTPEYRRIVKEVTTQGPLSDDALSEAIRLHPAYLQAGGKHSSTELLKAGRVGAAALVDSLSRQGIKARVETSKSLGSRSTYIYASKGDKTVKIRLSDHAPAENANVYGANDIMTTPQHWKSAEKRAIKILERN